MDKRIYLDSGFLNIGYILRLPVPFIFCVGGRGTGKTYGALKYVLDNGVNFGYMRRTQSQADLINKPEFSPFKAISRDTGREIVSVPITKYNAAFYDSERDGDRLVPIGTPLGYTLALSTISNLRGFDMSDVTLLIYDEFIPEKHERPLKNEASALFNAYETINRNRELSGNKPLKVLCLANANNIANPIFDELGIINKVYGMTQKGQVISINEMRGYAIIMLSDSPISERKRDTALYRLTSGTEFSAMAIDNSYNVDYTNHSAINLIEYTPIFTVNDITVYRHKSASKLYATNHISGGAIVITDRIYKKRYRNYILDCDANGAIEYENLAVKTKLLEI